MCEYVCAQLMQLGLLWTYLHSKNFSNNYSRKILKSLYLFSLFAKYNGI